MNIEDVGFISRPELSEKEQASIASILLAEIVDPQSDGKVLLLGCSNGMAAMALARKLPKGELCLMDVHSTALHIVLQILQVNQVTNVQVHFGNSLLPEGAGSFDLVAMELPKGRKLAQRWLVEAQALLRPGGELYLAGAKRQGILSSLKDAEAIFGDGAVLAYKKGHRLARFVKTQASLSEQGWWKEPGIAPQSWVEFQVETPVGCITLHSLPGVFSFDHLDQGTALLLPHLEISPQDVALDLGCGCGIIGLTVALGGAVWVDLVDENLLAVASTQENLRLHQVSNARVLPSDVLSAVADRSYSLIATNPPFHTGKEVDYRTAQAFIEQSWQAMEKGGRFLLVANRFLRYERLMERLFSKVRVVDQNNRYRVLRGEK